MIILSFLLIFIFLALIVGGDKTAKSIVSLGINAIFLLLTIFAIYMGLPVLVVSFLGVFAVVSTSLFFQNEVNIKTKTAFFSVSLLIVGLAIFALIFIKLANLQGFPIGQFEIRQSNGYLPELPISTLLIQLSVVIMVLAGTITDTSLAIISALWEVQQHKKNITREELFLSGISMGRDILSSTINTLLFIYLGESFVLFAYFYINESLVSMINSKVFLQDVFTITLSGIGCLLIIPLSSFVATLLFFRQR